MKRKILIALSIFLLLLLFSCTAEKPSIETNNNNENKENNSESMQNNNENEKMNEVDPLSDNLPDMDFEGYNFRILMHFENEGLYAEEEIGEPLNDSVYARNRAVEERFNINISLVEIPGWGTLAEKSILAGEDVCDILALHGIIAYEYIGKNLMVDWISNMTYNNLNAVWWNQNIVNDHTFFGKLYGATGDISYSALHNTFCLYFNKNLFQNLNIEYPYNDVVKGTWTLDKFISIVKEGTADLNGDGAMKPNDDRYGLNINNQWAFPVTVLYIGGDKIIKKDENGYPVLSVFNERTVDIYDKFFSMLNDKIAFLERDLFFKGQALFADEGMKGAVRFRSMEEEIGIIPMPKYNEQTPKYYSLMEAGTEIITVPITNANFERTSIIVEAMAAEGYKRITPAYYELVLKTKLARDEESAEMLDYIRDGMVVDYGYLNSPLTGQFGLFGTNLYNYKEKSFVSFYEKYAAGVQANIEKFINDNN